MDKLGKRITVILISLIGLMAIVPFLHELLHYIPAYFFGLNPRFDFSQWTQRLMVWFDMGESWMITIVMFTPELVLLPIAAVLTWKFRNSGAMVLALPFLLVSIQGFLGHAGYL